LQAQIYRLAPWARSSEFVAGGATGVGNATNPLPAYSLSHNRNCTVWLLEGTHAVGYLEAIRFRRARDTPPLACLFRRIEKVTLWYPLWVLA
jgi:hypothetical protein